MARDDYRIKIEIDDDQAGGLLETLGLALNDEAGELAEQLEKRRRTRSGTCSTRVSSGIRPTSTPA